MSFNMYLNKFMDGFILQYRNSMEFRRIVAQARKGPVNLNEAPSRVSTYHIRSNVTAIAAHLTRQNTSGLVYLDSASAFANETLLV